MKRFIVSVFFILLISVPAISTALLNVHLKSEFGQAGSGPGQFISPQHIAIDKDGTIYVVDRGNRRVHVMTPDGRTLRTFGEEKSGKSYLDEPTGIALYENYVYVSDAGKDVIFIFTKDGRFITQFGRPGSGPKEFDDPAGLTVHLRTLYVSDRGNHRVQVFSTDGIYLGSFGEKGEKEGQLREPSDVAVDYRGYVYVADYGNSRIQVFTPDGRFKRNYYDLKRPVSIEIDEAGFIVIDSEDYKIKKFDFSGRLLFTTGTKGDGPGQFMRPSGIALSPEGYVYVSDAKKNTVQVFAPERSPVPSVEVMPPRESVNLLNEVNVKASDVCWWGDVLYAVSSEDNAIYVIEGSSVRRMITGMDKYRLKGPSGIAIDRDGYIWVSDTGNDRILKFSQDGKPVAEYGGPGSREGRFSSPRGIYISSKGIVYIADSGNGRIQILNKDGVFMGQIKKANLINLKKPIDVQADNQGNIYVADAGLHTVFKINPQERLILSIGKRGEGIGEFNSPVSLFVTPEEIYILDSGNHRIQVFDHNGRFMREFGSRGDDKGGFLEPSGLSIKEQTILAVADNKRSLQIFRILHTPGRVLNVKALPGTRVINLSWAPSQESYIAEYRIYRSEDGVNYKFISSTSETSFVDFTVNPGKTYCYRISARARDGYEGMKSEVVTAIARKPLIPPPSGIVAKASIREIELKWNSDSVKRFVVLKKRDGSYDEIAIVDKPFFIDKGLLPDTEYTYRIVSLSPDDERSEPVEIKARTLSDKPGLEINILQMRDIITKAYRLYEKEGLGKLRLKNILEVPLKEVKVRFIIKEFMDAPFETELKEISPQQSVDIELRPVLSRKLMTLRENKGLESEIKVSYRSYNEEKTQILSHKIMAIYTGRPYTEAEAKRLASAMNFLDERVSKHKLDKELVKRLKERLNTDEDIFKRLRNKGLSPSEVVIVLYLSRTDEQDILMLKDSGTPWPEIITIYDISPSEMASFIAEIERSLPKPKPKPKQREVEKGFYQ